MSLRTVGKSIWFAWELVVVNLQLLSLPPRVPLGETERLERAAWLSRFVALAIS